MHMSIMVIIKRPKKVKQITKGKTGLLTLEITEKINYKKIK